MSIPEWQECLTIKSRELAFYLCEILLTIALKTASGSLESVGVYNSTICFAQHFKLFSVVNDAGPESYKILAATYRDDLIIKMVKHLRFVAVICTVCKNLRAIYINLLSILLFCREHFL